ncbi:hypothetical protein B5F17_14115 [Butyricicoccus pullicaecorum]|uniref:SLH domain-containing protein n=1 Tax=Butyricicoccus pullicaecorum TaxID=501571 RepID=A0A1Y4L635_9FIRM|nr:hypothetical protein B5F17_14115 [Butyricicoccus pullicaecorum]
MRLSGLCWPSKERKNRKVSENNRGYYMIRVLYKNLLKEAYIMRYIKRKVVQSVATILAIIMVVTTSPLNAVRAIDLQALEKDRLNVQLDSTQDLLNTVDVNSMQRSEPQEQNATDVLTDIDHSGWTVLTNDNAVTKLSKGYGSYYLTGDLSLDITISKPKVLNAVTICLDGHSITGTITVESGAVLNIYDCQKADRVQLGKIVNHGATINLDRVNSVIGEIENTSTGTDAFSTLNITRGSVEITGKVFNSATKGAVSTINITEIENPVIQGDVTNENGTNGKAAVLNFDQIEIDGTISNTGGAAATLNLTDSTVEKAITNNGTVNLYGCSIKSGIDNNEVTGVLNIQDETEVSNGITSDIGTVNLYDAKVTNDSGNAIEVAGGTLNLDSVTVTGDTNGVYATNSATLNLKGSTIIGQTNQGIDAAWLEDAPGAINVEESEISGAQNGINSVGTGVHAINIVDSIITGTTQYGIYNTGEGAINFGGKTAITGATSDIYTDISIAAYAYAKEYTGEKMSIRYAGKLDPIQTIFVTNTENSTVFTVTDSTGTPITCQKTGTNWATELNDSKWNEIKQNGLSPQDYSRVSTNLDSNDIYGSFSGNREIHICLHSDALKQISYDRIDLEIHVENGAVVNIYDCSEEWITKINAIFIVDENSTLNLYGGAFNECHITNNGGKVNLQGVNIDHLSITNDKNGNIVIRGGNFTSKVFEHEYMITDSAMINKNGVLSIYGGVCGELGQELNGAIIKNNKTADLDIVGGQWCSKRLLSFCVDNAGNCGIYGGFFEQIGQSANTLLNSGVITIRGGTFLLGTRSGDTLFKISADQNNRAVLTGGTYTYQKNVSNTGSHYCVKVGDIDSIVFQGGTYTTKMSDIASGNMDAYAVTTSTDTTVQGGIYSATWELDNGIGDSQAISSYKSLLVTGGNISAINRRGEGDGIYVGSGSSALVTGGNILADQGGAGVSFGEATFLIVSGGNVTANGQCIYDDTVSVTTTKDIPIYFITGGKFKCSGIYGDALLYDYHVSSFIKGGTISAVGNALYTSASDNVWIYIEGGTISSQTDTARISGDGIFILGGNISSTATKGCAIYLTKANAKLYIKAGVLQGGIEGEGVYLSNGRLYLSGTPLLYGGNADLLATEEAQISARTPKDNLVYIGSKIAPNTVSYEAKDKSTGKIVIFNATEDDLAKFNMISPTDKTLVYWDYEKCDANGSYDNVTDLDDEDRFAGSTGNLVLFGIDITATVDKMPGSYLGGVDAQGQYQGLPEFITLSFPEGWYVSVDGGETYKPAEQYADKANALYDIWLYYYDFSSGELEPDVLNWDRDAGLYAISELYPKENVRLADNLEGKNPYPLPKPKLEPAEGYNPSTDPYSTIRFTSQENVDSDNQNERNLLVTMTESGTAFTNTDAENLSGLVAQNTKALTTAKENAEKDKDRVQGVAVIPQGTTLNRNDDSTLGAASAENIGLLFDALTEKEEEHADILQEKAEKVLSLTDSDKRAYEYKYADLVEHTNANVWVSSSNGSLMLWPYPEGTDQNTEFQMVHFDGINRDYGILDIEATIAAGSQEFKFKADEEKQFENSTASPVPCVTTEDGIVCYVPNDGYGMFALAWEPINTGNLEIGLTVSSDDISQTEEFPFCLTVEDKTLNGPYGDLEFTDGVANFALHHEETVTVTELPAGTKYTVEELQNEPDQTTEHVHDTECGYVEAVAGSPCNHVHDESCGYVAAVEGSPCTHVHSDECYTLKTDCVIAKDEQASENMSEEELAQTPMVLPSLADDHVCTEESGCITKVLNCQHVHDTECGYVETVEPHDCNHVHDDQCGYVAEVVGVPCKYDGTQVLNTRNSDYTVTSTNATGTIEAGKTIEVDFEIHSANKPTYTLTYETNSDVEIPDETYEKDELVELNHTPERDGYEFVGWYTDKELTVPVTEITMVSDMIVYAKWEKVSDGGAYHPEYKPNDKDDDEPDEELEESEEIIEEDVPLAETPWLNTEDHYAYIVGYSEDGTVRPNANITRAEVATIFFRLLTDEARDQFWSTSNNFTDVAADAWYNNAISTMVNAGIIQGYEDGTFRPNANITRAEFAAIASRFMSSGYDVEEDLFTDIANHWARDNINDAAMTKWINGYPDGTFLPDKVITRAEAVTLVNNVLQRKPDKDHMFDTMIKWPDNMDASAWYYEAIQEATNSHDYDLFEGAEYEIWTSLLENRDWAALEKDWVNAHRTGGEVM